MWFLPAREREKVVLQNVGLNVRSRNLGGHVLRGLKLSSLPRNWKSDIITAL